MFSQLSYQPYSSNAQFFSLWFDEISRFDYDDAKLDNELKSKEEEQSKLLNIIAHETKEAESKQNEVHVDDDINKLAWMTIDCIGVQTAKSKLIDNDYYWRLGNTNSICDISVKSNVLKHTPSLIITNLLNQQERETCSQNEMDNDDNDEDVPEENSGSDLDSDASEASDNGSNNDLNKNEVGNIIDMFDKYMDYLMIKSNKSENRNFDESNFNVGNGFICNETYKRCIVDAIKCRAGIENLESFLKMDFSDNVYDFKLTITNLISLLLEISQANIHQYIISSAIAQQIPIAIIYPMCKVSYKNSDCNNDNNNNDNNNRNTIDTELYLRDILNVASQSKLTDDIKCQIKSNRNKKLVMFVGSDQVKGKSSMLAEMYPNDHFNTFCKEYDHTRATPLHKNSVDLIFSQNENYHILDVHGSIDDPLFEHCSKRKVEDKNSNSNSHSINRMDSLAMVASLCCCVVVQINSSQLTSSINKRGKKSINTMKSLISQNKGRKIRKFITKLKKLNQEKVKFCLVIRDATKQDSNNINQCGIKQNNVFVCKRSISEQFCIQLKKWIDDCVDGHNINTNDNSRVIELRWWEKISIFGLTLPFYSVKTFWHNNNKQLYYQRQKKILQFRRLVINEFVRIGNSKFGLPFGKAWQEYDELDRELISSTINDSNVCCKMDEILRNSCNYASTPTILQIFIKFCLFEQCSDGNNCNDWLLYEYLYILDSICNDINYNKNSIGSCDLIRNCHAMLSLYKTCIKKGCIDIQHKISQDYSKNIEYLKKLEESLITFLETSFCRGCTIEFADGKYRTIADSMGNNFAEKVFASNNNINNNNSTTTKTNRSRLITIGIAGTQSIGKSTMLRRMFGMDTKSNAGQTTHGINFGQISCDNIIDDDGNMTDSTTKVLVIDTQGIVLPAKTDESKKTNNKIILGSLASSNVFLFNVSRQVKEAQLFDIVLWAYKRCQLTSDNILFNKKLIFIVRDCDNPKDLEIFLQTEKERINNVIRKGFTFQHSLDKKNNIDIEDADEKKGDCDVKTNDNYNQFELKEIKHDYSLTDSVNKLIDNIEYFSMPSAITNRHEFAKQCVKLRHKILRWANAGKHQIHLYANQYEWYQGMQILWKQVIANENILSVSDLTVWANQCFLQNKIGSYLSDARTLLLPQIEKLKEEILESSQNDHTIRCKKFNQQVSQLCDNLKNKMIDRKFDTMDNELSHIGKDLVELYKINFILRFDMFKNDNIKEFNQKSEQRIALDMKNHILELINGARSALEYANVTDVKKIRQKYYQTFNDAIQDRKKNNKMVGWLHKRLYDCYENIILQSNKNTGRHPTTFNELKNLTDMRFDIETFFLIHDEEKCGKYARSGAVFMVSKAPIVPIHIPNPSGYYRIMKQFIPIGCVVCNGNNGGKRKKTAIIEDNHVVKKMNSLVNKYITHSTKYDRNTWIKVVRKFDDFLGGWQCSYKHAFEIRQSVYGALHNELIGKIESKLRQLFEKEKQNIISRLISARDDENQLQEFIKSVNSIHKSEHAALEIKQILSEEIKYHLQRIVVDELEHFMDERTIDDEQNLISKQLYTMAFRKAFNSDGKNDIDSAYDFINDQTTAFETEINKYLTDITKHFWTKEKAVSATNFICDKVENILNAIDLWYQREFEIQESKCNDNNITTSNTNGKDENKNGNYACYKLRKFLKRSKVLQYNAYKVQWNAIKFRQNERKAFTESLKKNLMYFKETDKMILNPDEIYDYILTTPEVIAKLKASREYCFGCGEYCPLCGVKCQKTVNHFNFNYQDNKHCSHFHFLQAFNNVKIKNNSSGKKYKLCVDVCNSRINHNKDTKWRVKEWSWIRNLFDSKNWDEIKSNYNSWDFGDNDIALPYFDIQLLLTRFFDTDLQNQLIFKYDANQSIISPSDKSDILFTDEIDVYNYQTGSNSHQSRKKQIVEKIIDHDPGDTSTNCS